MAIRKKVQHVMTSDVEYVSPADTLREAAEKMRALNVGPLPVLENGRLCGMITDRDIVVRAIALGHDPSISRVSDAMTDQVITCRPEDSLEEVARIMKEHQVRRLLVVDDGGNLVGIIALGDLSQEASDRLSGDTLETISEPTAPTY